MLYTQIKEHLENLFCTVTARTMRLGVVGSNSMATFVFLTHSNAAEFEIVYHSDEPKNDWLDLTELFLAIKKNKSEKVEKILIEAMKDEITTFVNSTYRAEAFNS